MNTNRVKSRWASDGALKAVRAEIKDKFQTSSQERTRWLELALNEAEALAWQTDFPLLLFPTLAEEKISEVTRWLRRQELIRRNGPSLAFAE
jgi:hypothetical protein